MNELESIFDKEVYIAPVESGPEPTIRKLIYDYYRHWFPEDKANEYTAKLIMELLDD